MKVIFLGNPVPKKFITNTVNKNYSIADNIAQNALIKGLYDKYKKDFFVITVASNFTNPKKLNKFTKKTKIKLDCGKEAIAVGNLNYNKFIYYISIIFTYIIALIKIMKF